ncbi:hypothetical protein C8Q80DRAFT_1214417 [Daedaleopsis nitida]|nr:hypothetical protein C8Q80DRAFT_1214417 [Daedaleopsis nitida]
MLLFKMGRTKPYRRRILLNPRIPAMMTNPGFGALRLMCIAKPHILSHGEPGRYYLGCYKLSCLGCYHFIQAVNQHSTKHKLGYTFVVDGTHGYPYIPYAAPVDTEAAIIDIWDDILFEVLVNNLSKTPAPKRSDSSVEGANLIPPSLHSDTEDTDWKNSSDESLDGSDKDN